MAWLRVSHMKSHFWIHFTGSRRTQPKCVCARICLTISYITNYRTNPINKSENMRTAQKHTHTTTHSCPQKLAPRSTRYTQWLRARIRTMHATRLITIYCILCFPKTDNKVRCSKLWRLTSASALFSLPYGSSRDVSQPSIERCVDVWKLWSAHLPVKIDIFIWMITSSSINNSKLYSNEWLVWCLSHLSLDG